MHLRGDDLDFEQLRRNFATVAEGLRSIGLGIASAHRALDEVPGKHSMLTVKTADVVVDFELTSLDNREDHQAGFNLGMKTLTWGAIKSSNKVWNKAHVALHIVAVTPKEEEQTLPPPAPVDDAPLRLAREERERERLRASAAEERAAGAEARAKAAEKRASAAEERAKAADARATRLESAASAMENLARELDGATDPQELQGQLLETIAKLDQHVRTVGIGVETQNALRGELAMIHHAVAQGALAEASLALAEFVRKHAAILRRG